MSIIDLALLIYLTLIGFELRWHPDLRRVGVI